MGKAKSKNTKDTKDNGLGLTAKGAFSLAFGYPRPPRDQAYVADLPQETRREARLGGPRYASSD